MNLKLIARSKIFIASYRGINDFKQGCQPRNNTVKDRKGDLATDPHSIRLGVETISLSF